MKADRWALQDAKARLSELVERVVVTGRPQRIMRRGKDAVVVISEPDYARMTRPHGDSLVSFMKNSPLCELADHELNAIVRRSPEAGRRIEVD